MEVGLVKQGPLYLQHQQRFGKKWKKVWGALYETNPSGLARLEMYEGAQPPETGRKQECWKLLQLSECVSLSERSGESSPKDTRAFSIETTQRVYLIASDITEQPNWVRVLCSLAFPQERRCLERTDSQPLNSSLQLQENSLYSTSQEAATTSGHFLVRVRQTSASSRCGLSGMYTLVAEENCLSLRDRQAGSLIFSWPYPYLRRFGRDKTMFSFEAGRRCASGEGNFEFETAHGCQIFQAIECAIKASQNDASSPTTKEQPQEEAITAPRQPIRSSSLHPSKCPQSNPAANNTALESEYAVPFDKVAKNLLATGFGGLLGPVPTQRKSKSLRKHEHIYDEPELPVNPVYDEPEGIRVDAWKSQGTDAHDIGYEYPYLPGWDDYAVPRGGGTKLKGGRKVEDEDEWGNQSREESQYDNITLKAAQES
ncbi:docking protein 2 [Pseudophryne corroboree]|uniref:docking protein 2 n=1 Tax=Pseudophryne corroboree TaxID=495146 RepID=UPI003081E07B